MQTQNFLNRTYHYGISLPCVFRSGITALSANSPSFENNAKIAQALNIDNDAKRRITLILDKILTGTNEVITSPYVNEKSPEEILAGLDSIVENNKSRLNDVLYTLEVESNRSKFGAMSIQVDWYERMDTLYDSFAQPRIYKYFAPYDLCEKNRLRPITVPNAVGFLKNDSNSGFPHIVKKKNVKDLYLSNTLDGVFERVFRFMNFDLFNSDWQNWKEVLICVLFTRSQEKRKTRNVWGYPILVTILEMCFYRPILEIQRRQSWRSALRTPEEVSLAVTKLIDFCIANKLSVLSIDFSRYDNSLKYPLVVSAFEVFKRAFQEQYHKYLDLICDFMVNCPIITPDGVLIGEHGVPSGSTFTNEVDSVVQFGIAQSCKFISSLNLSQIQGDDGLYPCSDPKQVIDHFRSFGLTVNDDKSYIANNWGIYLQSLFHDDYRDESGVINGIYPIYRALNRILFLERYDDFSEYGIDGVDYFSIRTICILENCKHHPLFKEFVTYVWSLDKYRLKVSDQGLANYVRKLAIQEGKDINFRNWSYGSDTSGLKSFESVKIINSLNVRV